MNLQILKGMMVGSLLTLMAGCGVGGESPANGTSAATAGATTTGTVDITSADAVAAAVLGQGGTRISGAVPTASTSLDRPTVTVTSTTGLVASTGGTTMIPIRFTSSMGLGSSFIQVNEATQYIRFDHNMSQLNQGTISLPVGFSSGIRFSATGQICVNIIITDTTGLASSPVQACLEAVNLGTGNFQVTLTWDNSNDIDLYVLEPSSNLINFRNTSNTETTGMLDRDDRDGLGPENIFWTTPPDGQYVIGVDHFSGATPSSEYTITVNAYGQTQTYMGAIESSQGIVELATVTISGTSATIADGASVEITP